MLKVVVLALGGNVANPRGKRAALKLVKNMDLRLSPLSGYGEPFKQHSWHVMLSFCLVVVSGHLVIPLIERRPGLSLAIYSQTTPSPSPSRMKG